MGWDGDARAVELMRGRHGGRLPVGADGGATMDRDERLARAVEAARHTAMVEAGRTPVANGRATMVTPLTMAERLERDNAALRAAVARAEAERDDALVWRDAAQAWSRRWHKVAFENRQRERELRRREREDLTRHLAALAVDLMQMSERPRQRAAEIARLEAARDAARAALDGLVADAEHFAHHNHRLMHDADPPDWRSCGRGVCPGQRRALERARAALGLPPYIAPAPAREGGR